LHTAHLVFISYLGIPKHAITRLAAMVTQDLNALEQVFAVGGEAEQLATALIAACPELNIDG
jgi:hypothetical protein